MCPPRGDRSPPCVLRRSAQRDIVANVGLADVFTPDLSVWLTFGRRCDSSGGTYRGRCVSPEVTDRQMCTPLTSGFLICLSIRWLRSTRRRRQDPWWLRRLRMRAREPAQTKGGISGSESRVVSAMTGQPATRAWLAPSGVPPPGPGGRSAPIPPHLGILPFPYLR
ncbi:hypothetical protein BN159_p126 (plasmid) [Streptomyces davaonensis JCM 4913]|uniref:Uncharacterized protein n=1 Tax=Streptomyces davaonensis (strain DSM 101723 / JCM 4913 / KCC S-0913 / 768) TaxID=1214101 RepID=K4RGT1_STRDJ|nr:hypothetical protein BN159_p126 [Streptomyces davaonensis JCM 4913]